MSFYNLLIILICNIYITLFAIYVLDMRMERRNTAWKCGIEMEKGSSGMIHRAVFQHFLYVKHNFMQVLYIYYFIFLFQYFSTNMDFISLG